MTISQLLEGCAGPLIHKSTWTNVRGKRRFITRPSQGLRRLHRKLLERLGAVHAKLPNATAYAPGSSPLHNALPHLKSRHFYLLDIKNAYPSVRAMKLARALVTLDPTLGTTDEVETFLRRYCMDSRFGLMQGGPASPALFNLYCEVWIDRPLRDALVGEGEKKIVYTRFADDLTFSSEKQPFTRLLRRSIKRAITGSGLCINWRKSASLVRGKDAIEVTGVRFLGNGGLGLTASYAEKLTKALRETSDRQDGDRLAGLVGYYLWLEPYLAYNRQRKELGALVDKVLPKIRRPWQPRLPRQTRLREVRLYSEAFLDELRVQVPLVEVVSEKLAPCRRGVKLLWSRDKERAAGLCPFHAERNPSFMVFVRTAHYHCFGCGAHGDVFSFIMHAQGVPFTTAVEIVSQRVNIPLRHQSHFVAD